MSWLLARRLVSGVEATAGQNVLQWELEKWKTLQRWLCMFKLPSCHWVTALVGKPHSNTYTTAINETSEHSEMSPSRHAQQPEKGHHHLVSLGKWAPARVPKHSHKGCRARLLSLQKSFLVLQLSELCSRGLLLWICRGESWCSPLAHHPLALPWIFLWNS